MPNAGLKARGRIFKKLDKKFKNAPKKVNFSLLSKQIRAPFLFGMFKIALPAQKYTIMKGLDI